MLNPRGAQVAEKLREVFRNDDPGSLQLKQEHILDHDIRCELAEESRVFVEYLQAFLLLNPETAFAKAMDKCVLVDFFQVAGAVVAVNGQGCFADDVAQGEWEIFRFHDELGSPKC